MGEREREGDRSTYGLRMRSASSRSSSSSSSSSPLASPSPGEDSNGGGDDDRCCGVLGAAEDLHACIESRRNSPSAIGPNHHTTPQPQVKRTHATNKGRASSAVAAYAGDDAPRELLRDMVAASADNARTGVSVHECAQLLGMEASASHNRSESAHSLNHHHQPTTTNHRHNADGLGAANSPSCREPTLCSAPVTAHPPSGQRSVVC
jgi:hypothetical protein